jgi:hypothetical protein
MGQSTSSLGRARRTDPGGSAKRQREVQSLFDEFARALTSGDGELIARLWEAPAFVVGDGVARGVASLDEVRDFFRTAKDHYNERGIIDTRADMVRTDWPTKQIALVEIHWPYFDTDGKEIGGERSTYTLRRDEHGALKIRAVVMHGEDTGQAATA